MGDSQYPAGYTGERPVEKARQRSIIDGMSPEELLIATGGEGRKDDHGKIDWSLLPWDALEPVVRVLEFGAQKYARENWRKVPNSTHAYRKALLRHVIAWCGGEQTDPESGLPTLAHAACCVLFLLGKRESP